MPNAVLTFKEYLEDYASPETRKIGYKAIREQLQEFEPEQRQMIEEKLEKIDAGERDLYV